MALLAAHDRPFAEKAETHLKVAEAEKAPRKKPRLTRKMFATENVSVSHRGKIPFPHSLFQNEQDHFLLETTEQIPGWANGALMLVRRVEGVLPGRVYVRYGKDGSALTVATPDEKGGFRDVVFMSLTSGLPHRAFGYHEPLMLAGIGIREESSDGTIDIRTHSSDHGFVFVEGRLVPSDPVKPIVWALEDPNLELHDILAFGAAAGQDLLRDQIGYSDVTGDVYGELFDRLPCSLRNSEAVEAMHPETKYLISNQLGILNVSPCAFALMPLEPGEELDEECVYVRERSQTNAFFAGIAWGHRTLFRQLADCERYPRIVNRSPEVLESGTHEALPAGVVRCTVDLHQEGYRVYRVVGTIRRTYAGIDAIYSPRGFKVEQFESEWYPGKCNRLVAVGAFIREGCE